jgi:hypothetical protein
MDMPTPTVYRNLAATLPQRTKLLWKLVYAGLGFCLVAIIWAYSPTKLSGIDPFLRLAIIVTGASASALLALVSFIFICVQFWFGSPAIHPELIKRKSLWPRLGDFAFGFSDWYACIALFCLLAACVGLITGMITYGLVPIVTIVI